MIDGEPAMHCGNVTIADHDFSSACLCDTLETLFEDVTTTFFGRQAVRLTGPNGSQSNLMKLLTASSIPRQGTVVRPSKWVCSPGSVAFDSFRVIDTVVMGNRRLGMPWPSATSCTRSPDDAQAVCASASSRASSAKRTLFAESDAAILLQG